MKPSQYEHLVAQYFKDLGYETTVSSYSNDYGVDVFAIKGSERIAIQAKMYGGSTRRINRQVVMQLHGAKDYFDCSRAIIATDGEILENALEVAHKLKIEVIKVSSTVGLKKQNQPNQFEAIWTQYVMPLEGSTLKRSTGKTNQILKVDWGGVERITSNNRKQTIPIEIFRHTINHILTHGKITRDYINNEFPQRASSGIILILGNSGFCELTSNPNGLRLKK